MRGWVCDTVYPNKYAHGFAVLCFVVVMQSSIMNSHEAFIHIDQGCFAGTGAIVSLMDMGKSVNVWPQQSTAIKAKTVCIFLGMYCTYKNSIWLFFELLKELINIGKDHCIYLGIVTEWSHIIAFVKWYKVNDIVWSIKDMKFWWNFLSICRVWALCLLSSS